MFETTNQILYINYGFPTVFLCFSCSFVLFFKTHQKNHRSTASHWPLKGSKDPIPVDSFLDVGVGRLTFPVVADSINHKWWLMMVKDG